VDDLAMPMHIVESNQALARQFSNQGNWNALIVVSFDKLKEIDTQDLEYHDEVLAIGAVMNKGV
jgi:hypothetical protein